MNQIEIRIDIIDIIYELVSLNILLVNKIIFPQFVYIHLSKVYTDKTSQYTVSLYSGVHYNGVMTCVRVVHVYCVYNSYMRSSRVALVASTAKRLNGFNTALISLSLLNGLFYG